jgi:hypothetical protein
VIEPPADRPGPAAYSEQLRTPWWWYLGAIAVAVLLGAEFALAVSGWISWVPGAILVPLCVGVVWRLSSGRVAVSGGRVIAGEDELALADIRTAVGLSSTELRHLVGRHSDPVSHTFVRSWVGPGVQLILAKDSAVPYWVVSTRHPDRLLAALGAASIPLR